jgi:hypothetical protein
MIDPTAYPPPVAALLRSLPLAPLGPGAPDASLRAAIEAACVELPEACRAGLWLAFGYLDESHEISQGLHTAEGSYWHALMHRREPDADNSKYWFRRVGSHPVLKQLAEQAPSPGYDYTDPFAFVDFVERVRGTGGAEEELAKRVQHLEWQLLFHFCHLAARPPTAP